MGRLSQAPFEIKRRCDAHPDQGPGSYERQHRLWWTAVSIDDYRVDSADPDRKEIGLT